MFRIMSEKAFQKALRNSYNEGYDKGHEDGKSYVEKTYGYINDCMQTLYKKESCIQKMAKERIVEILKDVVIPNLKDSINEATDVLDFAAAEEAESEQEAVPPAES